MSKIPLNAKSTTEEIRTRFDSDVERFSNLDTGQESTIDALLSLELISSAAVASTPHARSVLDIGCGAGNASLKLLQKRSPLDFDLADLSQPMLEKAFERISAVNTGTVRTFHGDIR